MLLLSELIARAMHHTPDLWECGPPQNRDVYAQAVSLVVGDDYEREALVVSLLAQYVPSDYRTGCCRCQLYAFASTSGQTLNAIMNVYKRAIAKLQDTNGPTDDNPR